MELKAAIAARFSQLCAQRDITVNELANRSGVTPSTVYSMMDPRRHDISVRTVKKTLRWIGYLVGRILLRPYFR